MQTQVTRLDYCQYLLVSQINYTLTHFADHCAQYSHDAINRYVRGEQITPRLIWENVKGQIVPTMEGYVLFDLTFRTLFRSSEAIWEAPLQERGGGAIYGLEHAL